MVDDKLRVCVDYTPVAYCGTGLGRYAEKLGRHLLERDDLDTRFFAAARDLGDLPAYVLPRLQKRWAWNTRRWRLSMLLSHLAGLRFDRHFAGTDVVHCTEHLLVPLAHVPAVLTVHDVVYLSHPEWHLPMNRWFLTLAMPRFARAAQAVVAVSDFTGREVISRLGADPARVHVIYEGVDDRFEPVRDPQVLAAVRARYNLRPPFILFVGAIEPRKNLPTLLRAFAALCREPGFEHQLVVAGGKGWLYDDVYSTAAELNLGERCVFTGRIADEDLPALYSTAEIYAHPAHFEGFGLTPLEAMACGTPVVTSDATSLPEVVGEAGLLVPPHDVGAWVAALRRLSGDAALRRRLSVEGLRRARRFRWEETARRTAELYREVAYGRRN